MDSIHEINSFTYLKERNSLNRLLISSLIFLAPLSMGPVPYISVFHRYIMVIVAFSLLLVNFELLLDHKRILPTKYTVLLVWFSISFFFSVFFGPAYIDLTTYTIYDSTFIGVLNEILFIIPLQLFLIFFIYLSIKSIDDILYYIKIFLISGFFINALAIIAIFGGIGYDKQNRLLLTFEDANYLGRFEVFIILLLLIFIFFESQSLLRKIFYLTNVVLGIMVIFYTSSRAALLTFAVASTILLFFNRSKVLRISFLIVNFFIFSYLIVEIALRRGVGAGGGSIVSSFLDISNTTRLVLNYSATQIFWDNPIFGIGYRNFYNIYINQDYVPDFIPVALHVSVVHSWFFSTLAELGLFGLIPLCFIIFLFFKHLFKVIKKSQNHKIRLTALCLFSILFVFIFNGLFFPVFFPEVLFSLIFGLCYGYVKLTKQFLC